MHKRFKFYSVKRNQYGGSSLSLSVVNPNPKARSTLVAQILGMVDYKKSCRTAAGHGIGYPLQGQMVITGPQLSQDPEKRMGFCVQVRKGCGQFVSDISQDLGQSKK
jgi:ABC-type cobalamin transport system ATPase subunit